MKGALPAGTVTFLLTDIEGSTTKWDRRPQAMRKAMERHDEIVAHHVRRHGGEIVEAGREGDSALAAFPLASQAVAAAADMQRALSAEPWPAGAPVRVRIAVHTGEAELRDSHYQGVAVSRCARMLATTYPGEVLISQATRNLVADSLPDQATLEDLGVRHLKDLERPERVFRLVHPDLPAGFPPVDPLLAYPNNLPAPLTSFVGRTAEVDELLRLLSTGRVVSVTGAAGCGKTRLAMHAASRLVSDFADGVWLAEIGQVNDARFVGQAVATVLEVREEPGRSITESLAGHLKHRQVLLVLDGCEHVVEATARLADELLLTCPGLRLLVTSREALRVPGETTWRIPSLSLPDEALALFLDRARLSNPKFELAAGQVAEAGLLCRRLDGIPLAIELAAAHVRMMSVGQILDRVEDRFRLLTGGSRTAVPRQQTMRAAVDWSYHHLEEAESRLFRRLSVFSGGFSTDSLEAVCSDASIPAGEILDLLSQLVDKSLVVPEPRNGASFRYRLLETLSEYGREQLLESDEAETIWQRHATHFQQLAETADDKRIAEEHANLSGALEFLRTAHDERGLRLAVTLVDFWDSAGHVSEGRERLQSLLQSVPAGATLRARALDGAGWMAFRQADVVSARALFEEARALLAESGDSAELARVMSNLGMASVFSGELDQAREHLEASLRVGREAGAKKAVAGSLWVLGLVAYFAGDLDEAEARAVESLRLSEETGDRKLESFLRAAIGIIAFERGQYEEAHKRLDESLEMSVAIGDRLNTALLLEGLCRLAAAESNWSLALRLGGAAAGLREAAGAQSIPLWQDRVEAACEEALDNVGQEAGTAIFEGGRTLEYIEAVSLARGSGESKTTARSR